MATSCVTAGDGLCRFEGLPLGGWVLHQSAAPRDYEATDDVAFALARPGQVARIRVVNGTGVAAAGVRIIEIIDGSQPTSNTDDGPWWGLLPRGLGAFLQRGWVEALLFGLTGMLFGAPAYLAHRRRELGLVRQRR